MKKITEIEEIKKEFEKKFIKHKLFGNGVWGFQAEEVWSWIASKLSEAYESGYDDGKDWCNSSEKYEPKTSLVKKWGAGPIIASPYGPHDIKGGAMKSNKSTDTEMETNL